MTARRDPDRLIRAFLMDGQTELADQVYDAVRATIDHKRQRVVIGPWRMPNLMNKFVSIGLGTAAVVVALVLGMQFLPSAPGGVGGPPSASPSPSPTPTPTVTPSTSAAADLPEGPFLVQDTGGISGAPRISVTIPASGWTALSDFGGLLKGPDEDPPQSAMLLWAWPAGTTFDVYGDPCHWLTTKRTFASTVDELATALAAQPTREGSDPVTVTVGPYAGKRVTLLVPNDAPDRATAFADCDQQIFGSYGTGGSEPVRSHQGPGQIDDLWILDVDGKIAIIDAMSRGDTPQVVIDEMRSIAGSATFE